MIVSADKFLLEHFYYGQVVQDGKPVGSAQLLAASEGVSPELAKQAVERVSLPPLIRSAVGAWALVRGRSRQMPFLLVQSQQGDFGQVISHYIIAPSDVLKAMGGNQKALMALVQERLPVFTGTGEALPLQELFPGEPTSIDEQIENILELMNITSNRTNLIEPLLAAIVQGKQLIVQGAPEDIRQRIAFIEGLLALLPPSARFGVTFTTHSLPSTEIDTQIRFYSDDVPPKDTVVFNWTQKLITGGDQPDDDYSRFVISQLRLDAELVIRRNMEMTTIAGWRLNQGENLVDALGYASQRLRLDEALLNNQPVDKDEVARILVEDPTLSDEMRVLYGRHLIKFSLAMEDMQHAEPVAILLRANYELERATLQQMDEAVDEGLGWLVYDTLVKWMSNPLGPEGTNWVNLTHRSALALLQDLIEENAVDEINALLRDMQTASPGVDIGRLVPKVIEMTLPIGGEDALVAENQFLLAVKYVDVAPFMSLMNVSQFRDRLPPAVTRTWAYIRSEESYNAPAGMLLQMARGFGQHWEPLVLLRFAEAAVASNHLDVLDMPTLGGLAQLALSPDGGRYAERILRVINRFDNETLLRLENPAPFNLLQIRLALGDYLELGRQMLNQSAVLYPGDLQIDYLRMIERLFTETPVPPGQIPQVLESIQSAGIKSVPLIVASIAGLADQTAMPELDEIAGQISRELSAEDYLLEVIAPATILKLLNYYIRQQDLRATMRVANLVAFSAIYHGNSGIKTLVETYRQMEADDRLRSVALQLLRVYVRQAEDDTARRAAAYFGRELSGSVRRALEITYRVRQLMGSMGIVEYARLLHITAVLLQETVAIYTDSKRMPSVEVLLDTLDGLPGGLSVQERRVIARDILTLGKLIVQLGKQYQSTKARDENRHIQHLLAGEANPNNALDVLRVMSGYLSRGKRFTQELSRLTTPHPLDGWSSQTLMNDLTVATTLLNWIQEVFPADKAVNLTAAEIRDEMESIWNMLEHEQQREIIRDLAVDLQRLPEMIVIIESTGDAKALENSSLAKKIASGKYQPRSTLEFYGFIRAYYASRS